MTRPHPALFELAAGRPFSPIDDLDKLLASAVEHRMYGLLWSRVEAGELIIDGEWETSLAIMSLRAEAHHRRLWRLVNEVSSELAEVGVKVAQFKGVTAEARWYDRMGQRPSQDVDLLLDPRDFDRVDEVLRILSPEHELIGRVNELVSHGNLQALGLWVNDVSVDLHFDLLKLGYPALQRKAIWDGFEPFAFPDGRSILTPRPEIALLQRLVALNRDRFPHVLAYTDVARIAQDEPFDWRFLADLLRGEGIEGPGYAALDVVTVALELDLPRHPNTGNSWRGRIWRIAWRPSTRLLGSEARFKHRRRGHIVLPAIARGRLHDAIRYWWHRLFPPRDLFDYLHPEGDGPFFWRFLSVRASRIFGGNRPAHRPTNNAT